MPGMNFASIHEKYGDKFKIVKYYSAKRERIVWQFLPWSEILNKYDIVFINGNPRVFSDFMISTVMHFTNRNVVLWTMAHSYKANQLTEYIRLKWSKIFNYILVYNDNDVSYLKSKNFHKSYILGINNGLDQVKIDSVVAKYTENHIKEWKIKNNLHNRLIVLSCARLESKNKFNIMVQALSQIINIIPNILWCLIGDGDERDNLEKMVTDAGIEQYVRFVGALYQEEELAPWFISSEIFIHPAAIGLSLLHAFGYGLPVITHGKSEYHGPEYSAFTDNLTGRNFIEGDAFHLSAVIVDLLKDKENKSRMKEHVLCLVRNKYNVDVMVERFVKMTYAIIEHKHL